MSDDAIFFGLLNLLQPGGAVADDLERIRAAQRVLDDLEEEQVRRARREGFSWSALSELLRQPESAVRERFEGAERVVRARPLPPARTTQLWTVRR